jgi:membrane associated rhomboid family serine protease
MKKIITYFKNLPLSIKYLLAINISVNFLFIFSNQIFNYDLNDFFGAYRTGCNDFNIFQILTFMFCHSLDLSHLTFNLFFFLIFAPKISKIIGDKKTIVLYVLSGIISFIFFNHKMNLQNKEISNKLINSGIKIENIKENYYEEKNINEFASYNRDQKYLIDKFKMTNKPLIGASGSIFAFMIIYPFFFYTKKFSILPNIILLLNVYLLIDMLINDYFYCSGTAFGHLGGVVGGLIFLFFIIFLNKKKGV